MLRNVIPPPQCSPRDVIGWESLDLRYVWSRDEPVTAAAQIFADQTVFHGRHFTIGTNPWSHHVQSLVKVFKMGVTNH